MVWVLGWGPLKKDLLVFVGVCVSASLPVCVPVDPRRRRGTSLGAKVIGRYERPVTGSGVIWSFPGSWNWLIGKAGSLAVNSRLRIEGGVSWVASALLSGPE